MWLILPTALTTAESPVDTVTHAKLPQWSLNLYMEPDMRRTGVLWAVSHTLVLLRPSQAVKLLKVVGKPKVPWTLNQSDYQKPTHKKFPWGLKVKQVMVADRWGDPHRVSVDLWGWDILHSRWAVCSWQPVKKTTELPDKLMSWPHQSLPYHTNLCGTQFSSCWIYDISSRGRS